MSEKVLVAEYGETKCSICSEREWSIATRDIDRPESINYYCGRCWNIGNIEIELNKKGNWVYIEGKGEPRELNEELVKEYHEEV